MGTEQAHAMTTRVTAFARIDVMPKLPDEVNRYVRELEELVCGLESGFRTPPVRLQDSFDHALNAFPARSEGTGRDTLPDDWR